jgi:hypothetical protein
VMNAADVHPMFPISVTGLGIGQ